MNIKKNKNGLNLLPNTLLAVVVICAYLFLGTLGVSTNELTHTELMKEMSAGKVNEMTVTPKMADGIYIITGKIEGYKEGETFTVTVPYTDKVISDIYETAEAQSIKVKTNTNAESIDWMNL